MGYRTLANNTYYSNVNDRHIMKEDAVFNEELRDYIFIDNSKNDQESINRSLEYIRKRKEEREKLEKKKKTSNEGLGSIFERYFGGNVDRVIADYGLDNTVNYINAVRQELSNDTEPVSES
jgi:hypothetical protein